MIRSLVILFLFWETIHSSPFQLTDQYVEEYKHGVDELMKMIEVYEPKEEDYHPEMYNETQALLDAETYDFVIVGAGGSGAVVASRLSEIPEWKILVLEAGQPETRISKTPKFGELFQYTPFNWGFITTPQKHYCQGMIDKRCAIAGGRALGGGTAINGMMFTRGNPKDYDHWADLGNDGWCWRDVFEYFKRAEDAHLTHFDYGYHNRGGPVHLENQQYLTLLNKVGLKAGKEIGLDTIDYNGKTQIGLGTPQVNIKHGVRQSTATSYLEPAQKRDNLKIKTMSHVTQLIIAPHTKDVTGVKYLHDGKLHIAKASKEVILSAGAINSAQLLMLSGIGPKSVLEPLEIPIVQELPVGQKLTDHIAFIGLDYFYNKSLENPDDQNKDEVVEYLKNGKGPLAANHFEVLGYTSFDPQSSSHRPDVEILMGRSTIPEKSHFNPFRFSDDMFNSVYKHKGEKTILMLVMLAHPKSFGSVTLKDKDPLHRPLVDPNLLSDPEDHDVNTILKGVRKCQEIAKTEAMKELGVKLNDELVKGCESHKWDSDDYWRCAIRHLSISFRHVAGTAKMGPKTDKEAVVDNRLKVYGVNKLRVVDNSILPVTITGHMMAPAIMIGEKGSDLIKEDWKLS